MANPSANQLSIPFRKSNHLSISAAIRQYISKKYDQHPDMFRHDLEVVDALRRDATNVREAHPSGIKKLQAYAAQLVWISGKFPIDIGADFTWYPALGYNTDRPVVHNNLKFELMSILFNLAVLYSQLALASNRSNTDGLKTAANYFSQAAGVFKHIKDAVLPELRMATPPEDLDDSTLESLIQLQLAQSQECFWQKAVIDGYKDASISKVAARVSDLYNLAGEAAMNSESISSSWIHHVSAKHHHFAAAAQYRAACDCLEKRKYGEEVARLTDAVVCANEGLKEGKGGYLNKAVMDDLNGLKRRVEDDLKRAEKDNDVIYLHHVPAKSELKVLERANMAVARVPPEVANPTEHLGDQTDFGTPLFSKLVPYSVHVAVSIYEERRDRLVNQNIIQDLEALNEKLHEILSSLNLPGSLQALEKPLGLPGTLVQHAEEIRQADALSRVQQSFTDIDKLRSSDRAIFDEGRSLLATEEDEDQRLRMKYGTQRWMRPSSKEDPKGAKLWEQVASIEGYFSSSTSIDAVVREKWLGVESTLSILAGSDRALMDAIPQSRKPEIHENVKIALGRLRGAYNDIQRLESRRRRRAEALREKAKADDIKPDIMKEAARLERTYPNTQIVPAHFEDFFEKRLDSMYEADLAQIEKEASEQEKFLAEVTRANREFEAQKKSAGDRGSKEREAALQALDNAYYKYKEIVGNVETGRKFYNDLSKIAGTFRDRDIGMPPLSSLSLGSHQRAPQPSYQATQSPPQQYYQNAPAPMAPISPPPEPHVQSWARDDNAQPPEQPQPRQSMQPLQGMWNPEMGIKFAQSQGAGAGGQGGQAGSGNGPSDGTPDDIFALLAVEKSRGLRGESSRQWWTTEADLVADHRIDAHRPAGQNQGADKRGPPGHIIIIC
ncbi:BRO1-like domain-containing protein [Diaporthe helianthi]|uniref:BRO1-like domain-containing protein n=1 Tax=Diaporthe helianthi TaxID=158607 RepID=A0A2P5I5S0_DIAHE|nr:BRO1-like domain-containing protein [Diaporthe helianthi]